MVIELTTREIQEAIKFWYVHCEDAPSGGEVEAIQIKANGNDSGFVARIRFGGED